MPSEPETNSDAINIQVFDQYRDRVSEQWLALVVGTALNIEATTQLCPSKGMLTTISQGSRRYWSIGLVIADDDTVRDLNHTHRGLDENTDVLAFSFAHQGSYYGNGDPPSEWDSDMEFVMPPGMGIGLGEVIISYPRAEAQAQESGRTVTRELALLLAHGVLHLLGYDHLNPDEELIMKAKESEIVTQVISSGCL